MTRLDKTDKRMFEYINHLHFGGVDHKDLSWEQHSQRPASPWKFPMELETYFKNVFVDNKDIINNKKVLDIGCEYGTKIPWFDKMQPSELVCIDPNKEYFYIANYISGLTTTNTVCVNSKAEDFTLTADTIFLLSVNHHFEDQFAIYERLECNHLVLDTWTDRAISISHITNFLEKKYTVESETYLNFKKNRVVMRYKKNE
jgi:SAM-dependent methyltransferase